MKGKLAAGRDFLQLALAVMIVLELLVAASLLPGANTGEVKNQSADIPQTQPRNSLTSQSAQAPSSRSESANGGETGGAGALNLGQRTRVGGDLALNNLSTTTHFLVNTSDPAYWRTGAFSHYTGTAWRRTGETSQYDNPLTDEKPRIESHTRNIELAKPTTNLPVAWRPVEIRFPSHRVSVYITEQRGFGSKEPVPAGTQYKIRNYEPPTNPQRLNNLNGDIPATIRNRYTRIPSTTPKRVGELSRRITNDASTTFEKVRAIERWLETNKEYSLDASHNPGGDVTDQFLFSMERGYCEYFATSMAVMLRTLDIPARYTVGYTAGERVQPNRYKVRGMHAHAWIEVYFPEIGWVPFDPTPAQPRQAAENRALINKENHSNPDRTGSPQTSEGPALIGNRSHKLPASGTLLIKLDEEPVPGKIVTVTVIRNEKPVSNIKVTFNGRLVGRTNSSGKVAGEVPYNKTLEINASAVETDRPSFAGGISLGDTGRYYRSEARLYNEFNRNEFLMERGSWALVQSNNTTRRIFDLNTAATLNVTESTIPGASIVISASIGDVPLRRAKVSLNGTQIGRTNRTGSVEFRLPDKRGVVRLSVTRGAVSGNTTIQLYPLSVTLDAFPVTLAGWPATINVTRNKQPVNAQILLNGKTLGRTGEDGKASTTLPLTNRAVIEVKVDGRSRTHVVSGLLTKSILLLLGFILGFGGLVAGIVVRFSRSEKPRTSFREVLIQTGRWMMVLFTWLENRGKWIIRNCIVWIERVIRFSVKIIDRFRAKIPLVLDFFVIGTIRFYDWALEVPQALYQFVQRKISEVTSKDRSTPQQSASKNFATPNSVNHLEEIGTWDSEASREYIRKAWRIMAQEANVNHEGTKTPREIASIAEEKGFPVEAVETVTNLFRSIEYGGYPPTKTRVREARVALAKIREEPDTQQNEFTGNNTSPKGGSNPRSLL